MIFTALLQCSVSAGRATCCHRSEYFHAHFVSQPVLSFMHAEELWPNAVHEVDMGDLWETMEQGEQEPGHGSDCMPKSQVLLNLDVRLINE